MRYVSAMYTVYQNLKYLLTVEVRGKQLNLTAAINLIVYDILQYVSAMYNVYQSVECNIC